MNLFISASHPAGDLFPIIEVVDDFDCFSPGLLARYPIEEIEHSNPYEAGIAYARKHNLTPIQVVINCDHPQMDEPTDVWAKEEGPLTHSVSRGTRPDGEMLVCARDKDSYYHPVDTGTHAPFYAMECEYMTERDALMRAVQIAESWDRDVCNFKRRYGVLGKTIIGIELYTQVEMVVRWSNWEDFDGFSF